MSTAGHRPNTASSSITPEERSSALDTIRGVAVLGILLMNIQYFALPSWVATYPEEFGGLSRWDRISWHVQSALFNGRMRGLFSLLFGVGLWLQWRKAERDGRSESFGDLWSRRCVWLALFGMVHGYVLQWPGDILFTYGICGLFLFPFRKLAAWAQVGCALLIMLVATAFGSASSFERLEEGREIQAALRAEDAGERLDPSQEAALDRHEQNLKRNSVETLEAVAAARRGADWVDEFIGGASVTAKFESVRLYRSLFWDAFGFMLLGLALGRWRFFEGRGPTALHVGLLILGFGIAVPWTLSLSRNWEASGFSMLELEPAMDLTLSFQFTRLAVGLAHASLIILLLRSTAIARMLRPLAAVGRTAFSNYILQTVICTAVFYGWGLAWFGTLSRAELMVFSLAVWGVALLWSPLWLRVFGIGPLEWIWRRLVQGRRPPAR